MGVGAGVGVGVAVGVGRGVGDGVGRGVGVGAGVGVGVGAGVGDETLIETESLGNVPDPQFALPLAPGLSAAPPDQDCVPPEVAVPLTRNTA